jgi:hypothetical protein
LQPLQSHVNSHKPAAWAGSPANGVSIGAVNVWIPHKRWISLRLEAFEAFDMFVALSLTLDALAV